MENRTSPTTNRSQKRLATPSIPVPSKESVGLRLSSPSSSSKGHRIPEKSLSPTDVELNRVHEELEKLNIATDVINKLELQLDEARTGFREIQSSWSQQLEKMSKKLGACIDKSRPYYEARLQARAIQEEAQKAALHFERANGMHAVAKRQVALTHDSLNRQEPGNIDPACLEVLNHHVQRDVRNCDSHDGYAAALTYDSLNRQEPDNIDLACLEVLNHHVQWVNDAEVERLKSEEEHKKISLLVEEANRKVSYLEKEFGRQIKKSRPYFDFRVQYTKVLEDQKALVQRIQAEVRQKKMDYQTSLNNLEKISENIHEQRQLGDRGPGVGSENPEPVAPESEQEDLLIESAKKAIEQLTHSPHAKKVGKILERLSSELEPMAGENKGRSNSDIPVPLKENGVDKDGKRRASFTDIQSGVILLAQQLSESGLLFEDSKVKAFSFPPEDLDVQYKTVPEGVKPFPTPPATPNYMKNMTQANEPSASMSFATPLSPVLSAESSVESTPRLDSGSDRETNQNEHNKIAGSSYLDVGPGIGGTDSTGNMSSETSSLASMNIEDERLNRMLKSHTCLIWEIEQATNKLDSQSETSTGGSRENLERGSASGDSNAA